MVLELVVTETVSPSVRSDQGFSLGMLSGRVFFL
jgi:hypothetical protein